MLSVSAWPSTSLSYVVNTVVDVEFTGRRVKSLDASLLFECLGIEDDDLTIGFFTVLTVPNRGPNFNTILIELEVNGGIAFYIGQLNGLDNLTRLFGDDLNTLLNFRLRMLGLISPNVVGIGVRTQEHAGAVCLDFVADFPRLIFMTSGIVAPYSHLANTQVGGSADRTAFLIVPVCAWTRMRLLVDIDHRFQFLRLGIDDDHFVGGVGRDLKVAAGGVKEAIMQVLGGVDLGDFQIIKI